MLRTAIRARKSPSSCNTFYSFGNARTYPAMTPPTLKRPNSPARDISPPPTRRKITGTATNKAVANFFKPASERAPEKIEFNTLYESLLVARYENANSLSRPRPTKIAAFDLDDTLITTKSALRFARNEDDWKWWHADVPTRLKQLHEEGYVIVAISNQAAVKLKSNAQAPNGGMKSLNVFKAKISSVMNALDLPMSVYAATGHDIYRKPRTGMWEQLLDDYHLTNAGDVDLEHSLFVGDAAGRAEDKVAKLKKDHSCSDRDFASNVGISFHTPQEFFLEEDPKSFQRTFDAAEYLQTGADSQTDSSLVVFTKTNDVELVLLCGSPGAGKSTFYWRYLQPLGYERVNQDILKTRDKCMKVAAQFIQEGKPVAVDNTNADIDTRGAWIGLAKKMKVPIRLVHFTASAKLCEHNDTVRALTGPLMNPESRVLLPKIAFTGYASRYREPKVDEGFEDITKVHFKFEGNDEQKALWGKYWIS